MILDLPRFIATERTYWQELDRLLTRLEEDPYAQIARLGSCETAIPIPARGDGAGKGCAVLGFTGAGVFGRAASPCLCTVPSES